MLGIAESDELQAVANAGIDTRSQIHLVYDLRLISDIWVLTIDIVARRPNPFSYLRRLCLRVARAAVESRLCMSSGALPGPDLLRAIPGVL